MAVTRWDPWKELAGIERQFEELVSRFGGTGRTSERTWAPSVDVHQDGDTLVIRAEVAGVDPADIEITVDDDVLTIAGKREQDRSVQEGQWIRRERMAGEFSRSISLPPGTDPAQISAKATHGVIEVRVPRPAHPEPRRIPLQGSASGERIEVDQGRADSGGSPQPANTGTTGPTGTGSAAGAAGTTGSTGTGTSGTAGTAGTTDEAPAAGRQLDES